MVNVKRIRETLEVQSDILTMNEIELLEKYTTDVIEFDKFLTGVTDVMDNCSFAFFFRENYFGISSVVSRGARSFLNDIEIPVEDTFLQSMNKKIIYITNNEESYNYIRHHHPDDNKELTEQYECIQAGKLGMHDPDYKYFLIELPKVFEQIMSGEGNTSYDSNFLSGVAYIAIQFPELAATEEFNKNAGDLSIRKIRHDSLRSEDPRRFRTAGRCARRRMKKLEKDYEKGRVKSLNLIEQ